MQCRTGSGRSSIQKTEEDDERRDDPAADTALDVRSNTASHRIESSAHDEKMFGLSAEERIGRLEDHAGLSAFTSAAEVALSMENAGTNQSSPHPPQVFTSFDTDVRLEFSWSIDS